MRNSPFEIRGPAGFLVDAPFQRISFAGGSDSADDVQQAVEAQYFAAAARTVLVLAKRTNARIIWATSRQVAPGHYIAELKEILLSDLGPTEKVARSFFVDLIKSHLDIYGWHQFSWQTLGKPQDIEKNYSLRLIAFFDL